MGYVHNREMSQLVPPEMIGSYCAGGEVWTFAVQVHAWYNHRTNADTTHTIYVPVLIPSSSVEQKGSYLKSIEFMWSNPGDTADDFATVKLYKDTLKASAASGSGSINTAAEVTGITIDAGHDSAAERKASGHHRMVVTLDVPEWIGNNEAYHLEMVVNADAISDMNIYGAIINYTLRT